MLDRKIKDYDASIELLMDRRRTLPAIFLILYTIGLGLICVISNFFSTTNDDFFFAVGIALLIVATYILMIYLHYCTLIFIRINILKEEPPTQEKKQ